MYKEIIISFQALHCLLSTGLKSQNQELSYNMELVLNLPMFEGLTYFYTAAHSMDYEVFIISDFTTIHTYACILIGMSHI